MAQGDLYKLLRKASNTLAKDMDSKYKGSERFRERIDKYPHDLHISRDSIRDEILIQLQDFALAGESNTQPIRKLYGSGSGRTREQSAQAVAGLATTQGLTAAQIKIVEEQADLFVKDALNAKPPRGVIVKKIAGDNKNFVLRFTPTNKKASVYDAINNSIFKPAKSRLVKQLNQKGLNITSTQEKVLFNIGHITSVSTVKAGRALNTISRGTDRIIGKYDDPLATEAVDLIRMGILSKFTQLGNPEYAKELLIKAATVRPESQATNLTDSDYERAILQDVKTSIERTLKSLPVEWASQRSSDSIIDLLSKELVDTAIKRDKSVKVNTRLSKKNTKSSNSGTLDVKLKKQKIQPKTFTPRDFNAIDLTGLKVQPSTVNLRSLIPLLNQRLPDVVRSNMGQFGRLTNRTGRFSESAQIIDIGEGIGVTYSYMRNPYGVFERQGDRDPRPLIEGSIRQVAAGLIDARFNMRRV